MQRLRQNWVRGSAVPAAATALALVLGGCGATEKFSEMMPKAPDLTSFDWNPYSRASSASISPSFRRVVATPADYINADGSCATAASADSSEATGGGAVALQMTECAVVRALGAPEQVDLGTNQRGERTAKLLYSRGERPGLYSFTSGQLTEIERVAPPEPPPKPQKPPAKPVRR